MSRYDAVPPPDWNPPPAPTEPLEDDILREAFGDPDENGVYAPHVEGGK